MNKNSKVKEYNHSLGQNFIYDSNLLNELVDNINLSKNDTVLEIGAGAGTLTKVLCEKSKNVIAIEIDKTLMPLLNVLKDHHDNLDIINTDFLKCNLNNLIHSEYSHLKVVANIPYYISTEIFNKLLFNTLNIEQISCMVQHEVALKIVADNNNKNYGVMSCNCNHLYNTKIIKEVSAKNFTPIPKVDSAFVNLQLVDKEKTYNNDDKYYYKFIKNIFSQRRKTLANGIKNFYAISRDEIIELYANLGLKENVRGEQIDTNKLFEISKAINAFKTKNII